MLSNNYNHLHLIQREFLIVYYTIREKKFITKIYNTKNESFVFMYRIISILKLYTERKISILFMV